MGVRCSSRVKGRAGRLNGKVGGRKGGYGRWDGLKKGVKRRLEVFKRALEAYLNVGVVLPVVTTGGLTQN